MTDIKKINKVVSDSESDNDSDSDSESNSDSSSDESGSTKKKFNFKEYYNSNPKFRKRHLAKMNEKIACNCGRLVARCGLARHKRTKSHASALAVAVTKPQKKTIENLQEEIEELKKTVNSIKRKDIKK